jgi:hypothetical protein
VRRTLLVGAVLAVAAIAPATACGDSDDPIAADDVAGEWTGSTSQGQPLAFTVTRQGVTDGQFGYTMSRSCKFTDAFAISAPDPLRVEAGRFSTGRTQVGQTVFLTITGEFTSSTRATGTMLIQHAPCSDTLNISWDATKD